MKIFCIGIGGIGLSALARYYKSQGHTVSGSDMSETELTRTLQSEGINVLVGTDKNHIEKDFDLVVHTAALSDNHPELLQAKEYGIKTKTYFEALGEVTKEKKTIAICGTHGKTTTTAMTYHALKACGINPTVIVGSLLEGHNTNFIKGGAEGDVLSEAKDEWMVVEACEYRRSFLNLHPAHIIVTNIDVDHLDYYKDIDDIKSAFQSFAEKLSNEGFLVTHSDKKVSAKGGPASGWDLKTAGKKIDADTIDLNSISLNVLGEHNKRNAQLVISLLTNLGFDEEKVRTGLLNFKGTWRRLEYKGEQKGAVMYDDYGHHPAEIKATLEALREKYPDNKFKLIAVFQPHLYSRTKLLLDDFANAFDLADKILILPIYAAREKDDGLISSLDLVEKTHNAIYVKNLEDVKKYVDDKCHSGSVVITIGAGDVYKLHNLFKNEEIIPSTLHACAGRS